MRRILFNLCVLLAIAKVSTECQNYTSLSSLDRSMGQPKGIMPFKCDGYDLIKGWYRFTREAGSAMPTSCVPIIHCGTHAPGWLNGPHPTPAEGIVYRTVCYHYFGSCCQWSNDIRVRNCGGFFVYELIPTPVCFLRYCGNATKSVNTTGPLITIPSENTTAVEVRLMDGETPHNGRVEVRKDNGNWSTICSQAWDIRDAYVVCRMLNYTRAVSAGIANVNGTGPIYPNMLWCSGQETSIEQCHQASVSCDHSRDAAATCGNGSLTPVEKAIKVRLVGSNVSHIGRVDVQYNGIWGAVCDWDWDIKDAHVICRMLGYKAAESPIRKFEGEVTTRMLMTHVGCTSNEKSIAECYHSRIVNIQHCSYKDLAGVVCQLNEDPPPVQVRLAGGPSSNSGRVEVKYFGVWGTVCKFWWDMNDAEVVCGMLGYTAIEENIVSSFNSTKGISWLQNLGCTGTEMSIANCSHLGWGIGCLHYYDVGVTCKIAEAPQFIVKISSTIQSCIVKLTIIHNNTRKAEEQFMRKFYEILVNKLGENLTRVFQFNGVGSFSLGDGKWYKGRYNVPLKPGTSYNITVRAATKAQNGGTGYGMASSKTITTRTSCTYVKAEAPQFVIRDSSKELPCPLELTIIDTNATYAKDKNMTKFYEIRVNKLGQSLIRVFEFSGVGCFMIGDGKWYNVHYNAPLEPRTTYNITVRTVIKAQNEDNVYGGAASKKFTTRTTCADEKDQNGGLLNIQFPRATSIIRSSEVLYMNFKCEEMLV